MGDGFIFDEQNDDSNDGSASTLWIVVSVVVVLLIMGGGALWGIRRRRIRGKGVYFDERDIEVSALDVDTAGNTATGITIQEEDVGEEDIVVGVSYQPAATQMDVGVSFRPGAA